MAARRLILTRLLGLAVLAGLAGCGNGVDGQPVAVPTQPPVEKPATSEPPSTEPAEPPEPRRGRRARW